MSDRTQTDDIERELSRPRFIMMSGTYCSGKSTWTNEFLARVSKTHPYTLISFDDIMREQAAQHGLSMYELLQDRTLYKQCSDIMLQNLQAVLEKGQNLVLDITNSTKEWRMELVGMAAASSHHYHKTIVCMQIGREEATRRFNARNADIEDVEESRKMPVERQQSHYDYYHAQEPPSLEEGFDLAIRVPTKELRPTLLAATLREANNIGKHL